MQPDFAEIDLRIYLRPLIAAWKPLLGAAALAVMLTLAYSLTRPASYTASASLAVQPPLFSARISYVPPTETVLFSGLLLANDKIAPTNKVMVELAQSEKVRRKAYETWGGANPTLSEFKAQSEAKTGTDSAVFTLAVSADDPDQAMALTQAWVQATQNEASALYSPVSQEQQAELKRVLNKTQTNLLAAEQAWLSFQGQNRGGLAYNTLNTLLTTHLACQQVIAAASLNLNSLTSLEEALQTLPDDAPALSGLMQTTIHITTPDGEQVQPSLELSYTLPGEAPQTVAEQRAAIQVWKTLLAAQKATCEEEITALEPQILAAQKDHQWARVEENIAFTRYSLERESYNTLLAKTQEIAIAGKSGDVLVILRPALSAPASDRTILNLLPIVAGLAVLLIGALFITLRVWWRELNARPAQ